MTYDIITHRETFRAVFSIQLPPLSPEVSEALHSVSEALPTASESLSVSAVPSQWLLRHSQLPQRTPHFVETP